MIVKALSWALCELTKCEKDEVQHFIDRYDEVLHKKVLREVANKLVFGKKNLSFGKGKMPELHYFTTQANTK